jgi:integrase
MSRTTRPPGYLLHKGTGQARCTINGKCHYLGRHGSPESKDRYADLIARWRLQSVPDALYALTNDELALAYMEHAVQHYTKDGQPTSEVCCVRAALRFLLAKAGRWRARDFGPRLLKDVRAAMVDADLCRSTINGNVMRIRRMFKWGVAEEFIPPAVLTALQTVPGLRAGRSNAKEGKPVRAVAQAAIDAIQPYVKPTVFAAVQAQLFSGMRSGEVLSMRCCDLNIIPGKAWEYHPASHKTSHHGKSRTVFLGRKAQRIIKEFLTPFLEARLFAPYTVASYRRAIARACDRAGIERWFPHQLRHTAATNLRREAGIETAKAVLGHSDLDVTAMYAEADENRAREIMWRVG